VPKANGDADLGRVAPCMISAMADHDPVGSAERGAEQVLELQRIVNLTPQQIAIMEADGRISWLNDYALDYFGISLADLSVLDMRAYAIHPDDLPALRDQRRKELAAGVPFGGEVRMRGRDGIFAAFSPATRRSRMRRTVSFAGTERRPRSRIESAPRKRCDAANRILRKRSG